MKVAIYARVSTEVQEARGTVGSQLAVLAERVGAEGDELVVTFCDEGHSGARLDRPGLDALRDQAEAGLFEAVWCLSPDRLARAYAYQVLVIDELARHGVKVLFADAPAIEDDPQARLLTQVQGVIAEYERAKIAERNRRGKLWRARAGEVITWKAPYGYRRIARSGERPAHLEIFEPEAVVVRRIFADRTAGYSLREIIRRLHAEHICSPGGSVVWSSAAIANLVHNETYVGRLYYNQTEASPDPRAPGGSRQRPRPREEWIAIPVPAIVDEDTFAACAKIARRNAYFSPRRSTPGAFLLRGLVRCGHCNTIVACHKRPTSNKPDASWNRYYYCRGHDVLRAGSEERRCPERTIRADALDQFVFDELRQALLRPDLLIAGEQALATRRRVPTDELLATQLGRLDRKAAAAEEERRRLVDLYQAGLIELVELRRRTKEVDERRSALAEQRRGLVEQRDSLARSNRLQERVTGFAERVAQALEGLDFEHRQSLIRVLVADVRVTGWNVEINLRIPLEELPPEPPRSRRGNGRATVSTDERLRSLRNYGLRDGEIRCLAKTG